MSEAAGSRPGGALLECARCGPRPGAASNPRLASPEGPLCDICGALLRARAGGAPDSLRSPPVPPPPPPPRASGRIASPAPGAPGVPPPPPPPPASGRLIPPAPNPGPPGPSSGRHPPPSGSPAASSAPPPYSPTGAPPPPAVARPPTGRYPQPGPGPGLGGTGAPAVAGASSAERRLLNLALSGDPDATDGPPAPPPTGGLPGASAPPGPGGYPPPPGAGGPRRATALLQKSFEPADLEGPPPGGPTHTLKFEKVIAPPGVPPTAASAPGSAATHTLRFDAVLPAPSTPPATSPLAAGPPTPTPARPASRGEDLLRQSFGSGDDDDAPVPAPGGLGSGQAPPTMTLKFEAVIAPPQALSAGDRPSGEPEGEAPGALRAERRKVETPVLVLALGGAALALALLGGLALTKLESSATRALREARAASTPDLALAALEREGVSLLARADVQAIRARSTFARGNLAEARRAVALGEADASGSPEDKAMLAAVKGQVLLAEGDDRAAAAALDAALGSPTHLFEKDATVLGALAQALLALKDERGALPFARRAIEAQAGDPRARLVIARALMANGQLEQALRELEQGSNDHDLLLARGILRTRLGDALLGLRDIDLARGSAPASPEVLLARADALLLGRDAAGARAEAEAARGLGGDPIAASRALARAAVVRGRLEEAERLLAEAASREGGPQAALAAERAFVLVALDRGGEAEALLAASPATAAEPAEEGRQGLAHAFATFAAGSYDQAAELAMAAADKLREPRAQAGGSTLLALGSRFAVEAAGLPARALALAARARDRAQKPEQAKQLRAQARELAGRGPDILADAAEDSIRHGDLVEAARNFEAAIALAPDVPELEAHLGSVLVATGKWDDAHVHLEKALVLGATDPAVLRDLARTLLARGKSDDALKTLERARENGLDVTLYTELRKELARAAGNVAESRIWLERLVGLRPLDVVARRELADLLAQTDPAGAAREYEALLQMSPTNRQALRAWVRFALDDLRAGKAAPGLAEARLRVARTRLPDDKEVRSLYGRFLLQQGKAEQALAELDAALEGGGPAAPDVLRDRAIARLRVGATSDLYNAFAQALAASDPGSHAERAFLADVLGVGKDPASRGRMREGLRALAQAAADSLEVRLAYARSLEEAQDWKGLQAAVKDAQHDFPEERVFFEMKVRAERELKKRDER